MAQTIPEELPAKATSGERRLLSILKRLPGNVTCYYEPLVDNRLPDFVLIFPTLGVLLIEVKGWNLESILAANTHSVRIRGENGEEVHPNPLRQAREYQFALMDRCKRDKKFSELVNFDGPFTGRLSFPVASVAVLTQIMGPQLAALPNSPEVFPSASVATKDMLAEWQELSGPDLVAAFARYFKGLWACQEMTENQVNILKAALHPEILLSLDFAEGSNHEPTIKVLDEKQETLARKIGTGHRLIFGVAGSGKTVVLMARAKLLARLMPPARILVLCFNVPLGAYLSEALKLWSTITVANFHSWAAANGARWNKNDDSALGQTLLEILRNGGPDTRRFDCVLIDEAQDFESPWFACALAAMKDPVNGDLLIVGDGSQRVYRRTKLSWKQIGIRAQGRTQYLDRNYRNTRPILRLASLFSSPGTSNDEDGLGSAVADPEACVRTHGPDPVLLKRAGKKEEIERTIRIVDELLDGIWFGQKIGPLKPEEIGILYPRIRKEDRRFIEELRDGLLNGRHNCPAVWLTEKSESRRRIGEPGVKILTAYGAKGLQFRAVILIFADECPAHFADTEETDERRLFYVGLTRAEDYLAVSCSRHSKFVDEIKTAIQANVGDKSGHPVSEQIRP